MRYLLLILILFNMMQIHADNIFQPITDENLFFGNVINDSNSENELKILNTKSQNNSSIHGDIYIGENLLPKGKIYLLKSETKGRFRNALPHNINSGEYKYNKIEDGNYTLYIIPEPEYDFYYFPKYLPTYTGFSHKWKESVNIELSSENLELDLQLLSFPESFYGHKTILGEVTFNSNSKVFNNVPVVIFLLDENKIPMDFRLIDRSMGKYEFNNLPEGVYFIYPESPGINAKEFRTFINNESDEERYVNFYAEEDHINFQVPDDESIISIESENNLLVYLAQDVTYPIVCEIISISGCSVFMQLFYSKEMSINTFGLSAGIYILRIKAYDNSLIEIKKIYINNY